jgi:outer membrane protein assembly factor BamB
MLDGETASGAVAGLARILGPKGGTPWTNRLVGRFARPTDAAPSLDDAVFALAMPKAVEGSRTLEVFLVRRGGRFVEGAAAAPEASNRLHPVTAIGLRLDGGRLAGDLELTVLYDGQFPRHGRDVPCTIHIEADVKDAALAGRFGGMYGHFARIEGDLTGTSEPWSGLAGRQAFAQGVDWSAWRGPTGSGAATPSGHLLARSLGQAHLVWKSEERRVPGTWDWHAEGAGGYSDFAIADGRLFISYYWPGGRLLDQAAFDRIHRQVRVPLEERGQRMYYLIEADDVVLGVEAATGRTLWKTVFAGRGLNHAYAGRASPQATPCSTGGRVFSLGTSANLYALDARTGEPLWDADAGARAIEVDLFKQVFRIPAVKQVFERTAKRYNFDLEHMMCSSPALADGVVACNDHALPATGKARRQATCGLAGFDAATGRHLWTVPECLTELADSPARWVHRGKEYFIAAGGDRAVCVEPRTGKILWEVREDIHRDGTPATSEDHVVFCGTADTWGPGRYKPGEQGLSCWRITPDGATKAWQLDPQRYAIGNESSPIIYDGFVYAGLAREADGLTQMDLETGAMGLRTRAKTGYMPNAADGRIFTENLNMVAVPTRAGGTDVAIDYTKFFSAPNWHSPAHANFVGPVSTDGRLFIRGKKSIFCYDLRLNPTPPAPADAPAGSGARPPPLEMLGAAYLANREDAIAALAGLDATAFAAARPDLVRLLESGDWLAQSSAAEVLRRRAAEARPAAADLHRLLPALVRAKRRGPALLVADLLAAIAPDGQGAVAADLANLVSDEEAAVAGLACEAIERIGPPAAPAVGALVRALGESDAARSRPAARALAAIGPAAAAGLDALTAHVRGEDAARARRAARVLAALGPKAEPALAALADKLASPDPHLAAQSALALAALGPKAEPAIPAAIASLPTKGHRPRQNTQVVALLAVLVNTAPASIHPVIGAIERRGGWAEEALLLIGEPAVGPLIQALKACPDEARRAGIANVLAAFGERAGPALRRACDGADGQFRRDLRAILQEIRTSADFGG